MVDLGSATLELAIMLILLFLGGMASDAQAEEASFSTDHDLPVSISSAFVETKAVSSPKTSLSGYRSSSVNIRT